MTAKAWRYRFRATPVRAVDGDTIALSVDVGLRLRYEMTVRLRGCNAPEKTTPEGQAAITFVQQWLAANVDGEGWLSVTTHKDPGDKYGRWLADVESLDYANDLTTDLIRAGHAVEWGGHGVKPVPARAAP